MALIGIFWFDENAVLFRSCGVEEGSTAINHLIDSPFEHWKVWQTLPRRTAIRELEYQKLPRGRVLYDSARKIPLVYLDKTLLTDECKQKIRNNFELVGKVSWQLDNHYSTNRQKIRKLVTEK